MAVVTATTNGVREVDAATLKSWMDSGTAALVDVREPDEHAHESIPGSRLAPLSGLNVASLPRTGGHLVFHCRSGRRSAEAAVRAAAALGCEVCSLTGGIQAWKEAGFRTNRQRGAAIPIMRQVQLIVGSVVVIGTALGAFVSPWFLLLSGMMGAGLVFAGATGTCGMAVALAVMPWNRTAGNGACGAGGPCAAKE